MSEKVVSKYHFIYNVGIYIFRLKKQLMMFLKMLFPRLTKMKMQNMWRSISETRRKKMVM